MLYVIIASSSQRHHRSVRWLHVDWNAPFPFRDCGWKCENDSGNDLDNHPALRHSGYLCRRWSFSPHGANRRSFSWLTVVCLLRNVGQGGAPAVVPEKDRPLQERQRSELPHQVILLIKHRVSYLFIYFLHAHSSPRLVPLISKDDKYQHLFSYRLDFICSSRYL